MGNGHGGVSGWLNRITMELRRYNFIVCWFFLSSCDERIEALLVLIKPESKGSKGDPWRSPCI
jgi:hypothetical protein